MKRQELEKSLKALGLKKNDIVLLHSSVASLGTVDGGPDAVIDAFLNVLGKNGALIVPVFGKLGIITELVKARPGAVVSTAPVGTLAGLGGKAAKLLAGHWEAETAHGEGSPFLKIADAGGYVCLLGVDQDRNTMLHSVEALLRLPYLKTHTRQCQAPDGTTVTRSWKYYPGPHRDFIGLDHYFREIGIMKTERIGNAQVRLINAREMIDLGLQIGREDPAFVLCDNPACADCVAQRAAICRDRIAKEQFKLAASSRLAGRYVPEMVENLRAAGIDFVELDYIQGKAAFQLPAERLAATIAEFNAAGIQTTGMRVPVLPNDTDDLIAKCKDAGIARIILPLTTPLASTARFNKAGIRVDFVNQNQTALQAADAFLKLRAKAPCGFVLSPTNFVQAGEMPFLCSWKQGHFIRTIAQLDVADARWDGIATALACGNAEIKELISIIRCGNFSGFFVLGGGAPYPGTLAAAHGDLLDLLDHM